MKKLKEKFKSHAGESISETLISLLIAALALVMLAGAISSSTSVILKSEDKLKDYYDSAESLTKRTSGISSSNPEIKITDNNSAISAPNYPVIYYKNEEFSKTPVVAYEYIPTSTSTSVPTP